MTELSRLETLLEAVDGDPERATAFYEALLDSSLYVPVPGSTPISADDARKGAQLDLMVVEGDSGRQLMPVFDSAERALAHGANIEDDEQRTYAELPARALISSLDPGISVVLNPGAERIKVFDPEELKFLRGEIRRLDRVGRKPAGATRKLAFSAVVDLPEDMARDLSETCSAHPAIYAVYILEIEDAASEHGRRYLILLDADDEESDRVFKEAGEAVGQALSGHFMQGTYLEVANLEEEEAYAAAITQKNVAPVWSRGAGV